MANWFNRAKNWFSGGITRQSGANAYYDRAVDEWIDLEQGSTSGLLVDTPAGVTINPEVALRFSAVYACVNVISDTIATLPINLFKEQDQGKLIDKDHRIYKMLKTEPNEFQTWFDFIHVLVNSALRWGNGYARIHRDGFGRVKSLQYLEPNECSVYHTKDYNKEYLYYTVLGQTVPARDIIHIKCLGTDGIEGKSPISLLSDEIGLALQSSKTMSKFYKSGLKSKAVFSVAGILSESARKSALKQIKENTQNDHMLLEGDAKVSALSLSPKDAETIATRIFQVEDIARVYRVPLHKIGSMKGSTNNNIEQQTIDFVTDCILPWTERIEQEFRKKLLAPSERIERLFQFDTDYLMRGDVEKRSNYYRNRFNTGSITPNEIRRREGDLRSDNELSDKFFLQSGTVPMEEKYWTNENIDNTLKQ